MYCTFLPSVARTVRAVGSFVCVAGVLLAAPVAHAQGLYQPLSSVQPTGTTPQGVAAADFKLGGFQGLVVTNFANNNMRVYNATGPGTFAPGFTYPTCAGPTAVMARDFSGDGYPDIVVACPGSNLVEVYENDGTGNFINGTTFSVNDPVAMVAGVFNTNGLLGGAIASGSGGITVFTLANGGLVTTPVAAPGTLSGIVAGDFNHDGHLDVAASDSANNNVHIFNGDGTGNFTAAGSYPAGTGPSGLVVADLNHDGNLDLAVADAGSNSVSTLLGSATGAFTTLASPQAAGIDPIAISVADVNSDGHPDVIVYDAQNANSTTQGAYAVLLGVGDGTFQSPQISNLTTVPGTVAAVADFNRDGKPDLAITETTSNEVALLINNTLPTPYPGGRSFAASHNLTNGYGNMADSIATGDFNKDGQLDLAVSYLEDNAVRVLTNNGNGFNTAVVYPVGKQPYTVVSGDLNGDGYPDLVTANVTDGTVSVLMNNGKAGNGTFAAAATYTVGRDPYQVAIGDVNGDGIPDLAVTNLTANTVSVLFGQKGGTFIAGPTLTTGVNPYGVVIADFAHNGLSSIAVTCYQNSQLYIFPNTGAGTFGTPNIYTTDSHPTSLVTGDFNRDGVLDIVTGNSTANDISFFAGHGDNTFSAGVVSPSLNFPVSIAAADINGDGILDIVGVAPNYNAVAVTLGKGDGTFGSFQQRAQFGATKQPWAVALGDFNNDGQIDVATANTYYQVNLAIPAYLYRYMGQYPPTPNGQPSIDVLTNASAANISLSISPASPLPANNTGATLSASVYPAYSGGTPTGSVIFEDATGAPYGTGAYPLVSGAATASTGRLGSGQYVFTTLYSGDTNFQPTTAAGAAFAVTVAGTPLSLTVNPSTVQFAKTFTVSATATGTTGLGAPQGTVTVYGVNGGNTFTIGTITLTASGNNAAGSATFTADAPNLNVGNYEVYGYFNPSNGTYQAGSSSSVLLTVTGEPTLLTLGCNVQFAGSVCTATVNALTTGTPVPAGTVVNFTGPAGPVTATVGNNGQATYSFGSIFGNFTVTANFPLQSNYTASNKATFRGFCFFFCGVRRAPSIALDSVTGLSPVGQRSGAASPLDLKRGAPVPFRLTY